MTPDPHGSNRGRRRAGRRRARGAGAVLAAAVGAVASAAALAGESGAAAGATEQAPMSMPQAELPESMRRAVRRIDDAVSLPTGEGMQAVSVDGRLFFVSGNGRLIVEGRAHDAWTNTSVATMDDARRMAHYIDFDDLDVTLDELAPLAFGNGGADNRVIVATDPQCDECRTLFDRIAANPALARDYEFQIVLVPRGPSSGAAVRRYACAADQKAALEALFADEPGRLDEPDAGCRNQELPLRKRVATLYLLGLDKMPTLIAPNGRIHAGVPRDIRRFLEQNAKAKGEES